MPLGKFISIKQKEWHSKTAYWLVQQMKVQLIQKKKINIAISGGSTPLAIFSEWSKYINDVDWSRVCFFWVDERYVPVNDNQSNYGNAAHLLSRLPGIKLFPMIGTELLPDIKELVENYKQVLLNQVPIRNDIPYFDIICLGMGSDGHYASLFPGTKALETPSGWVTENWVSVYNQFRLTLTDAVIQNAAEVFVLVNDISKNELLSSLFFSDTEYPIQRIMNRKQSTTWIYSI